MVMPEKRPTGLTALIFAFVLLGVLLGLLLRERFSLREEAVPIEITGPEAVLAHRDSFRSAIESLARNDAAEAVLELESFSFGDRAAEPYRLYLLANAYSLAGDTARARRTLERAWRRNHSMVVSTDVAYHLLGLHARHNDWSRVASISAVLADQGGIVGAATRREHVIASFYSGDVGAMYRSALELASKEPDSESGSGMVELVTALRDREPGKGLDPEERLVRVGHLLDEGHPEEALELARRIDESELRPSARSKRRLAIGRALSRLGRLEESEEVLAPLFPEQYRYAIPALEASARNQRLMAEVPIPRRISRREKKRREERAAQHRALYIERLRDLHSLPISKSLRAAILGRLIDEAEKREQIEQMQRLITRLVAVDPTSDRGLQIMWDQGWMAFVDKNDPVAIDRFDFIAETYRNPSVRRQARYWLARSLDRVGKADRASEVFVEIASSPYEDLYTLFARERLGISREGRPQPLPVSTAEGWESIAEREMPPELRLAWELTLLGQASAAREEIRLNRSRETQHYADALLAETFHADGAWRLANRYLKRAFPSIGTAEQSDVPLHFLRMYYVLPFENEILEYSRLRNLDPAFVAALVHQETAFDPNAVSPAGALGLMQLMPATAREIVQNLHSLYQKDRLFDPAFNIEIGTYYASEVMQMMHGDFELTAAGYNGGPYRIRRWLRLNKRPKDEFIEGIPLRETRNYVKRIAILRSSYRSLYPSLRASG